MNLVNKVELKLDWATFEAAKYACINFHYSKSIPAGKLVKIGVWENSKYIGVVIFGRGANNNIGTKYKLQQTEVCELVRIALTKHITPVTRIAALAMRFLKKQSPNLKLIVSYADPEQGHHGGIYQGGGWVYSGRSQEQRELIVNGKPMHKRTAGSKFGTGSPEKIKQMTGLDVSYGDIQWKHTYLMPLNAVMHESINMLSKPYPKNNAHESAGC